MDGTGEDKVQQTVLADVPKSLEDARVDDGARDLRYLDIAVNRVADQPDLHANVGRG